MLLYDIFYFGKGLDRAVPLPKSNTQSINYAKCVNGEVEILYPDGLGGWTKEAPLRNYAVYYWSTCGNHWVDWGRFGMFAARDKAGKAGVVIDLLSKRMVWCKGKQCNRAKPIGIRCLPAHEGLRPAPLPPVAKTLTLSEAKPIAEATNQPIT